MLNNETGDLHIERGIKFFRVCSTANSPPFGSTYPSTLICSIRVNKNGQRFLNTCQSLICVKILAINEDYKAGKICHVNRLLQS